MKYLISFHVDWQQCEPFVIDAHVDWPPDENPDNNDIDDDFAVAGDPDTLLRRDSGILTNGWTWIEGYEYPDYALGSKWIFDIGGVIKYWQNAWSNVSGRPGGHAELFVFPADGNGNIIDNGQGGIMNMEFQFPEVYWTNYYWLCYNICLPVNPGDIYYFVWCNRQGVVNYWCIDDGEGNPDWNWQKQAGVWSHPNLSSQPRQGPNAVAEDDQRLRCPRWAGDGPRPKLIWEILSEEIHCLLVSRTLRLLFGRSVY